MNDSKPIDKINLKVYDIVSYVETKGHCNIMRFEPGTYSKLSLIRTDSEKTIIDNISKSNMCSWNTALIIYSSSFGAAQLMGFNLYGPVCKYGKSIFDYCASKEDQIDTFNAIIIAMKLSSYSLSDLAAYPETRHKFAITYNGAPGYADLIRGALDHFNFITH